MAMGGWNSGSPRRSSRLLDCDLHKLEMTEIAAHLHRMAHACGSTPRIVTLQYSAETGYRIGVEPHVELPFGLGEPALCIGVTSTRPRYGGVRYWFVCPYSGCRRRCSVLYREWRTNVRALRCQRCLRVRYESQILGNAETIAARISRPLSRVLRGDMTVGRPRYMHRSTYNRLVAKINPLVSALRAADPIYRHLLAKEHKLLQLARRAGYIRTTGGESDAG